MQLDELKRTAIRDVHKRESVQVREDEPLVEVVRRMREGKRGAVVVVGADGAVSGVFTERDLMLQVVQAESGWRDRPVGEVMTRNPTCVRDTDPISRALKLMRDGGFRHLPQVDERRRPVGIVSIRDILALVAEHFPAEFVNLPPDPSLEATRRWGG